MAPASWGVLKKTTAKQNTLAFDTTKPYWSAQASSFPKEHVVFDAHVIPSDRSLDILLEKA